LLRVGVDTRLYISEIASLDEGIRVFVKLCILIVDLHFVKSMISHSAGVYNESALCDVSIAIFVIVVFIIAVLTHWKYRIGVPNDFTWDEFTAI